MSSRVRLELDRIVHVNAISYEVYRSTSESVDLKDEHIMTVKDVLAVPALKQNVVELLERDEYTPYVFYCKRHFEVVPFPEIRVDDVVIDPSKIELFPDQKRVEIHTGDIGKDDGKVVRMYYNYKYYPVLDDYKEESGKVYSGPPATGLRPLVSVTLHQDTGNRTRIKVVKNDNSIRYFYRIYASDLDGNQSPWSDELAVDVTPSEVYFRIERSKDKKTWETVSLSNMTEWYDDTASINKPDVVKNMKTTVLSAKETQLTFANPWYQNTDVRASYHYRVRPEDSDEMYSEWSYVDSIPIFIDPYSVLIRRKIHNGDAATKTGTDAVDVFLIKKENVDINSPTITVTDDQLTEQNVYSYTFYLTDTIGMDSDPTFIISDNGLFESIILFGNTSQDESITEADFLMSYEIVDNVNEIGVS